MPSSQGKFVNPSLIVGRAVWFIYPYTGRPGVADPDGWDYIPGAHGSTPQAVNYRNLVDEFAKADVQLFGVSLDAPDWQAEFALRNSISFPLLSDIDKLFSKTLGLPVFKAGDREFLKRTTFVSENGKIVRESLKPDPATDAELMLAWCRS